MSIIRHPRIPPQLSIPPNISRKLSSKSNERQESKDLERQTGNHNMGSRHAALACTCRIGNGATRALQNERYEIAAHESERYRSRGNARVLQTIVDDDSR